MFGIGPLELVVIVVVALLIFGPQKLPEFARTLGKGLAEFRRASNDLRQSLAIDELQNDLRKTMHDATRLPPARPAQAGDSLPAGKAGSDGGAAPRDPATLIAAPTAATAADPPWKNNPGELPEGHDHDHHDPVPASAAAGSNEDDLGNVPVGGADAPADPPRG